MLKYIFCFKVYIVFLGDFIVFGKYNKLGSLDVDFVKVLIFKKFGVFFGKRDVLGLGGLGLVKKFKFIG